MKKPFDEPTDIAPLLITLEQAAAVCQISRTKLDEWSRRPGFPVIRDGGDGGVVRVELELLKSWLQAWAARTNAPPLDVLGLVDGPPLVPPLRRRQRG